MLAHARSGFVYPNACVDLASMHHRATSYIRPLVAEEYNSRSIPVQLAPDMRPMIVDRPFVKKISFIYPLLPQARSPWQGPSKTQETHSRVYMVRLTRGEPAVPHEEAGFHMAPSTLCCTSHDIGSISAHSTEAVGSDVAVQVE